MILTRALLAIFLLCATTQGAAPLLWRWSNPTPHGATIYDQAFRDGLLVQVGEAGQIFTTADDFSEFRPRHSGVTNSLRGVTWFGNRLIISAANGKILWSDNLREYNVVNLNIPDWLESVAASPTRVVAVGDEGSIYSSADGVTWTRAATQQEWLRGVAFGAGRFVAVGERGFITVSTDGLNWGRAASPTNEDLNRITCIDDQFWIVGNAGVVLTNTARFTWQATSTGTTTDLFAVGGHANEIAIAGLSEIRASAPPYSSWPLRTAAASPAPPPWTYYSTLWTGNQFVASGRSGIFVGGYPTNGAATSTWSAYYDPARNWMWGMVRVPDLYVACGEAGGIFTSPDGFRFDQEFVPDSATNQILSAIGGSQDVLVTVGTAGTILYSLNTYTNVVSTNSANETVTNEVSLLGLVWEDVLPKPTAANLYGVGKFGSTFLAVGAQGTLLASGDGRQWAPRASSMTATLSAVASSPNRAVIAGDSGALATSDNGILWTPRNSGTQDWITQVRYLNGRFVAVGEGGMIRTSTDGAAWTPRTSGVTNWLNDVTFVDNTFYAVGSQGALLRSSDSVTWERLRLPTTKSMYAVAGSEGQLVVAGVEGAILRARTVPFASPVNFISYVREGEGSIFVFNAEADQRFHLEWSDNWGPWQRGEEIEALDNSGLTFYYQPENLTNPFRVYRTVLAQ